MTQMTRRGALLALAASAGPAWAQEAWRPALPVRLLVGFPPGGFTDILARTVAPLFQARFDQSVVVENRSGAAGVIAAEATARAVPDGTTRHCTLLASSWNEAGGRSWLDVVRARHLPWLSLSG